MTANLPAFMAGDPRLCSWCDDVATDHIAWTSEGGSPATTHVCALHIADDLADVTDPHVRPELCSPTVRAHIAAQEMTS